MQSFIASVRIDITTAASLLTWMRSRGVEPGSTGTLIRLSLEFLEQKLRHQGLVKQLTAHEATHVLEGYRFNTESRGGRQGLLRRLQDEHIVADGLSEDFSDERVVQATGLSADELKRIKNEVQQRLTSGAGSEVKAKG